MSNVSIRVEHLGKRYHLRTQRQKPSNGILPALKYSLSTPFDYLRSTLCGPMEDDVLWALKDVSFEVGQGEIVGIIGRNGAGKSTLLKILSRITKPTEGKADLYGRVGSLIEVGTGFHPDLSGRENVFLNGTILGMRKIEISRLFDEIVDFAGVEKFIDTPVKFYSSGMKVRLGFAVAAHLEPEILLVDEVLAVGDLSFQKKSLGKIGNVARKGRTIIFVSHNMASIQAICKRGILLETGRVIFDGQVEQAIETYISTTQDIAESTDLSKREDRKGSNLFRFKAVKFLDANTMRSADTLLSGQDILACVEYDYLGDKSIDDVGVSLAFYTSSGTYLFACSSEAVGKLFTIQPGDGCLFCKIPKLPLNGGHYCYNILARWRGDIIDWVTEAGYFHVARGDFYNTGKIPAANRAGVLINYDWDRKN